MSEEIFTAWISKYALSSGVRAARVKDCGDDMVWELNADGSPSYAMFHRNEWHRDRASAVNDAEGRRQRKIASLKKQITKLEKLSFES